MRIESGHDLLAKELQDIHSAERLLSRELPRLSKHVSSDEVREKLDERLHQGEELLEAVEQELEELEVSVARKRNLAVEGLLEDAKQLMDEIQSEDVLDAALIAELQKVQHYCMAAWGTTAAYAREMEQESLAEAMERALEDGKRLDRELSELAEEGINPHIFESEGGEREETGDQRRSGAGRERFGSEGRVRGGKHSASSEHRERPRSPGKHGGEGSDLRGREYRDRQGQIHHHTRSYAQRHRGH